MITETGTQLTRHQCGEEINYPIPSIPGCAGRGNAHGWITRRTDSETVLIRLSNVDALNGGLAIRLSDLLANLNLTTMDTYMEMSRSIAERDAEIERLEAKITRLQRRKR